MAEIADIKRILKSNIKVPSNRRIQQRKPFMGGRSNSTLGLANGIMDIGKTHNYTTISNLPYKNITPLKDRPPVSPYHDTTSPSVLFNKSQIHVDKYSYFKYKDLNCSFGKGERFKYITSGRKYLDEVPYYISPADTTCKLSSKVPSFGIGVRNTFKIRDESPPPGAYTLKSKFDDPKLKNICNFGTRMPMKPRNPDIPGPGTYQVPSTISNKYSKKFTIMKRLKNPIYKRSTTPGPIYRNYSTLCDNNKFKNISFGIGERQFLSKQMLRNDAPPPGTYDMYTTLEATPFNQSIRPTTAGGVGTSTMKGPRFHRSKTPIGIWSKYQHIPTRNDSKGHTIDSDKLWN